MERDFSPRGVKFYYVYKALAHPETNHYVTPFTLKERLMHVAEAREQLGTRIPWLCDSMDNVLKHAMGDRPNSEFVIDPDGNIVVAREWSSPEELRNDLTDLVGAPERITTIADLNMKPVAPAHAAPTGVVPRIKVPTGMTPLKVEPVFRDDAEPFYVKLRAEADQQSLQSGTGKLYLGFMLDPLYHVHWNNEAMPVVFEIVETTGVQVAPDYVEAPEVSVQADADPREFLVDICNYLNDSNSPRIQQITLKVRYFACDDAQTFCKPVTQTYIITLERDRDGGARRSTTDRSGRQSGRANGTQPRPEATQNSTPNQSRQQRRREMMEQRRRQMQP
ncbi:MAG: hypothetical protein O2856_04680 [Planctomycetota bacterium]|nr:hypothetical protein [Planctomycetota bacterium]